MNPPWGAFLQACRRLWGRGALVGLGLPALSALLMLSGAVPPGDQPPEGPVLQLGHTFTGLVFLSAAWLLGRRGRILAAFPALPEGDRLRTVRRETLLFATLAGSGSLLGLAYWALAGRLAARHAAGFVLLAPLLFLALAPRPARWRKALEEAP